MVMVMAGSSKIEKFRGLAITFAFLGRLRIKFLTVILVCLYSFFFALFGPPAKTLARQFHTSHRSKSIFLGGGSGSGSN
jgi:hypothetical protein